MNNNSIGYFKSKDIIRINTFAYIKYYEDFTCNQIESILKAYPIKYIDY